jgi:plastocyanin
MKSTPSLLRAAMVIVLCGAATGCASTAEVPQESPSVVRMTGGGSVYQFEDQVIKSADGEIEFVNSSDAPHNVVWDDKTLQPSPLIKRGESWSVELGTPGVYEYVCTLHPGMRGVVEITAVPRS